MMFQMNAHITKSLMNAVLPVLTNVVNQNPSFAPCNVRLDVSVHLAGGRKKMDPVLNLRQLAVGVYKLFNFLKCSFTFYQEAVTDEIEIFLFKKAL